MTGPKLVFANAGLNWIAAAIAGCFNCGFMRLKECRDGIEVTNEDGDKVYGKSVTAGRTAVFQTCLSRFILPLPVLGIPALANFLLVKARLWPKNTIMAKIFELSLVTFSLSVGLPGSIALFEQKCKIDRSKLEEKF